MVLSLPKILGSWMLIAAMLSCASGNAKCFQCSSADNSNCLDYSNLHSKDCANDSGIDKCFTRNDDGIISRGCLMKSEECPVDICKSCSANAEHACNSHNICQKCSTNDPNCSQQKLFNAKYNEICESSATECFVNVKDKRVERRCATTEDKCDATSKTCRKTPLGNSNFGIFPTRRLLCHQCAGAECVDVATINSEIKPCGNYVDDDKCYIFAESSTLMVRGCKSDDNSKCASGHEEGCFVCNTDYCNNSGYEKMQKLKCIQCEGPTCLRHYQPEEAKECKEKILYNGEEQCFTMTTTKSGAIRRGCWYNIADALKAECTKTGTLCKKCNSGDGCNGAAIENPFTCLVCRSDIDKSCWNRSAQLKGKKCRTGEGTKEQGCFHGIWNGVAIRGCMMDADEKTKATCLDATNQQCRTCYQILLIKQSSPR
ncbi:uncharacterized protein LOC106088064 [Stomoxys calcitrans]|uniref:uncharacterized protein LOC106088064 n=1 Tax=Stomoxys calcitrans TaxID=35570 RepID=UPI0027E2FD6A|nr:uncharacterized protein LOC106088064 [Stomoxys calcitrans]